MLNNPLKLSLCYLKTSFKYIKHFRNSVSHSLVGNVSFYVKNKSCMEHLSNAEWIQFVTVICWHVPLIADTIIWLRFIIKLGGRQLRLVIGWGPTNWRSVPPCALPLAHGLDGQWRDVAGELKQTGQRLLTAHVLIHIAWLWVEHWAY